MIIDKGELVERVIVGALAVWTVVGTITFLGLLGYGLYTGVHDVLYPPLPNESGSLAPPENDPRNL